jgi:hypothetical protein
LAGAPAETSASATGATTSRRALAAAADSARIAAARAPRALRTGSHAHSAQSERWLRSILRSSEVMASPSRTASPSRRARLHLTGERTARTSSRRFVRARNSSVSTAETGIASRSPTSE